MYNQYLERPGRGACGRWSLLWAEQAESLGFSPRARDLPGLAGLRASYTSCLSRWTEVRLTLSWGEDQRSDKAPPPRSCSGGHREGPRPLGSGPACPQWCLQNLSL